MRRPIATAYGDSARHASPLRSYKVSEKPHDAAPQRRACQCACIEDLLLGLRSGRACKPCRQIASERSGQMIGDILDQPGAAELRQRPGEQKFDREIDL